MGRPQPGLAAPAGWLPPVAHDARYLSPAPAGWQFWIQDPAGWAAYRAPYAAVAKRAILIGGLMFVIGLIITVAGYLGELGSTFIILWGAIVFGAIRFITGLTRLAKADKTARANLTASALVIRRHLDTAAYPAYLDATARERAETGRAAMSLDEFAVTRDQEPWGATRGYGLNPAVSDPSVVSGVPVASGPSVVSGVQSPYAIPAPGSLSASPWAQTAAVPAARNGRRGLVIGLSAAVVVIAIGVAMAIPVLNHTASHASAVTGAGSGTGSGTGTGTGTGTGAGAGSGVTTNYDLPDDAWTVVDSTSCSSTAGCWQLEITPTESCPAATITWGFAATKTGLDKATRTTTVALTSGRVTSVSIPVEGDLADLKYIFYDKAVCAS